jgi:hypothetical protein
MLILAMFAPSKKCVDSGITGMWISIATSPRFASEKWSEKGRNCQLGAKMLILPIVRL